MDKLGNALENVAALPEQPVRNRHAGRAVEDLVLKLLLQPHLVEVIAPQVDVELQAAVTVVAVATAQAAVK